MTSEFVIEPAPPITRDDVAEPVKLPLLALRGKETVPFNVSSVAANVTGPFVCAKLVLQIISVPRVRVPPI